MAVFGRNPRTPRVPPPRLPSREILIAKLNSIGPGPEGAKHLLPEDVTGVIDLALERLQDAQDTASVALVAATERLNAETEATRTLVQRLTSRPPPPPPPRDPE